ALGLDVDEQAQGGVAAEFLQAGSRGGVPQEDGQQQAAPEGADGVLVAAVVPPPGEGLEQGPSGMEESSPRMRCREGSPEARPRRTGVGRGAASWEDLVRKGLKGRRATLARVTGGGVKNREKGTRAAE